ncbi:hypothetical protein C8F01DRAFT_1095482 [Mycena amicta]|nr:hypothetical protein C8F01DRAFT_1095482 [Mycena amicta]
MIIPEAQDAASASSSSSLKDTPQAQVSESESPPSSIKPTNHLSLSRRYGHISGVKFVIDPRLRVPPQMLALLEQDEMEETRRNLSLCAQDGGIDADVWVLSHDLDEEEEKEKEETVKHCSQHTPRRPLSLSLHTTDGSISLTLPRSFCGPLTVRLARGYARMRFSPAVSKATTVFSEEADGVRRCFVGDFASAESDEEGKGKGTGKGTGKWKEGKGEGKWTGDEATLSSDTGTFGSVWIEYEDERDARQWWWWYKRARENGPWMGASVLGLGVILVGVMFAR